MYSLEFILRLANDLSILDNTGEICKKTCAGRSSGSYSCISFGGVCRQS